MEYFPIVIYSVVCSLLGLMQMLYLLAQPCIFLKKCFSHCFGEKKKKSFDKVSIHSFPHL